MNHDLSSTEDPDQDPYQVLPTIYVNKRFSQTLINRVALLTVSVLALVAVIYGGYQFWYLRQVNPSGDPAAAEIFTITETDDLLTVSKRLEQEGFIVNDSVFRSYVSSKGGLEIAAGFYTFVYQSIVFLFLTFITRPMDTSETFISFACL